MTKFKQKIAFLILVIFSSTVYLSISYYREKIRTERLIQITQYCTNDSTRKSSFSKNIDIESHGSLKQSNVTIISVYFQLEKSKHSHTKYEQWLDNFFISVKSPLVILTDKKSIETTLKKRKHPTTLYITDSIWNLLNEIGHERNRNYIENYKCVQPPLDPEYKKHNPNLYALWNLKSFIADKIAQKNIYNSSSFIYTDAGAWRKKAYENWPDEQFVLDIQRKIGDKILFGQLYNESDVINEENFPNVDLIEGTFFMGSQLALNRFKNEFWKLHDRWIDESKFVGKDQTLMNKLAFKSDFKGHVAKLNIWKINCSFWTRTFRLINPWFYYQYFFATQNLYPDTCFDIKESLVSY